MGRAILLTLVLLTTVAAEEARWIRYPAISPDGQLVAFSYRGDIWVASTKGGSARAVTSHVGHETQPIWTPDGKRLVFRSERHGNFDLFHVSVDGGDEVRITHHSAEDRPCYVTPDGKSVVFSSRRLDAPRAALASPRPSELYRISLTGGQPRQVLTTPALNAQLSRDGARIAYEDRPGLEHEWRKHHVSSAARDVWTFEVQSGKHTKRTTNFRGEDRNPVWAANNGLYFLSERAGSFNVFYSDGKAAPRAVTAHTTHPVRFLSIAKDDTLAYAYDGSVWVKRKDGEPQRLSIDVAAGPRSNARRVESFREGATEMRVSPDEKEVAFIVRGEVFVASVKHGTTKRVTKTPQQERNLSWAPDGRTLYFAAERRHSWDLYSVTIRRKEESHFFLATVLDEAVVLATAAEEFQPEVAPDGKSIAYVHNRDEIRLLDLATKKTQVLVPAARNYSYADGDIDFRWSPDGRWLAHTLLNDGAWAEGVGVTSIETRETVNMTRSGYWCGYGRWSPDGAFLAYVSNRFGRRSHGSWGSDGDILAIDLTQKAHDRAKLSEEEFELLKDSEDDGDENEEADKKGDDEEAPKKRRGKKDQKKKKIEPIEIEFDNRDERGRRLTLHSADLGSFAIAPDGESIVYWARVGEKWDVWIHEIRKRETRKLVGVGGSNQGDVVFSEDGDKVFLRFPNGTLGTAAVRGGGGGSGRRGSARGGSGGGDRETIKFQAEMEIDGPAERRYMLEHCWRQSKTKFYRADMHGVDWAAMKAHYAQYLDHIVDNHEFATLLSEMVGELNASHTGSRYRIPQDGADQTASLGLLYEINNEDGLRVAEVLERGPFDRAGSHLAAGCLITHIDGVEIVEGVNPHALLNRKAGKRVLVAGVEAEGAEFSEVVRPIALRAEYDLLYRRFLKRSEAWVTEWSKGTLGYVHIRGMNDASFRDLFHRVLGRMGNKKGLVIDTRFNGGGWLHDDLVKFLGAKRYSTYQPRGKEAGALGGDPSFRWTKPVIVVQSQANYSDAHIFPYAFKTLKIGKLVGTPVAGTGTAVWWERLIDRSLHYGIPQVGVRDGNNNYLENLELQPDIEVYNDPNARAAGLDKQLKRAVDELLKEQK